MVTCCTSWLHGLDPKKFWGNGLFFIAQNAGEDNMKGWYYEVGMHYCLSIISNQILPNDKRGGEKKIALNLRKWNNNEVSAAANCTLFTKIAL